MAGLIPQSFIDDLVARTDIVELIGSRVPLKKAGREFRACCPFHNEKTPSFWVSPDKQFYHCFGCGAHGTSLGFLMNYDRMTFPEAVEELAERAGVEIPREARRDEGRAPSEPLYELNARVATFYAEQLGRDAKAREYAQRRGLEPATLKHWQIGYAPNSWNEVLKRFGAGERERRALADCGLVIERDANSVQGSDKYYDRFRDRLMFPIRDARGRVIAFGGRIIDQGEPKYLNSPETALFHKGRELYGLYETRRGESGQARTKLTRLLVVEGYMDVVRLHQAGVSYAVATLGTATTPEHLKRMFRLVSEVVFCFDGDRAGRAAAWRALGNALPEAREGREIRFLFLPEGEDPDSLVGKEGRAAFEARFATALPLSEYLVRELGEQFDLAHADGRARFAAAAQPLLAKVPEGVFRELLLERLAQSIGLSADRLRSLWSGTGGERGGSLERGGEPGHGDRRAAGNDRGMPRRSPGASASGRGSLVRQAVTLLVHFPAAARGVAGGVIDALEPLTQPGMPLLRELLAQQREDPCESTGQLLERWRERPEAAQLAKLALVPVLLADVPAAALELQQLLGRLADEGQRSRIDELLEIDRDRGWTEAEKAEFQRLMSNKAPQAAPQVTSERPRGRDRGPNR
jgi:DNA primase